MIKLIEFYWVSLDPTVGTEIQKTRPCVVVSPDELNAHINRVIVAPITSTIRPVRYRVTTTVGGNSRRSFSNNFGPSIEIG